MFKHSLIAAGLAGLAACQASRPLPTAGVYTTATAFRQQQPSLRGVQVRPAFAGYSHLFILKPEGSQVKRQKVASDSIWGYCRADGAAYRTFQHRAYKIRQADSLTIYSIHSGKTTHYYFSNGLNGPVQRLVKEKLLETYTGNPAFVRALDQVKWYQNLVATEPHSNHQRLRIVALYHQSLLPTP